MSQVVYTIGYAHHSQESFLELLRQYGINCIIDVRTMAYSKFHPQFNKEPLSLFLKSNGIVYMHMYKEFGIIRGETTLNNEDGYLDFNKLMELPIFKEGIERVERGIEKGYIIGFMCAEKDPIRCHRSTLVGRVLEKRGYRVLHIHPEGKTETHEDLEERILGEYYVIDDQISLFQRKDTSKEMKLQNAYRLCNNDIVETNSKRVFKEAYVSPKTKSQGQNK